MKPFLLLVLTVLLLTGCHWLKKKDEPTPLEQLPPATQEGKRAFGCLVNGQVWIPQGNNGTSNYDVTYDPTYNGGSIDIATYHITNNKNRQYIYIYSDSLNAIGTYSLTNPKTGTATFKDIAHCDYSRDVTVSRTGSLTITRLDLDAGIISGKFEFTLAKPGCDTVKVTNGRFDYKL